MTFTLKTHQTRTTQGRRTLVRTNHYVRIGIEGHPPIYLQQGVAYSEGGQEYESLPPEFEEQLTKLTPQARMAVGFGTDEDREEVANPQPNPLGGRRSRDSKRRQNVPPLREKVRDTSPGAEKEQDRTDVQAEYLKPSSGRTQTNRRGASYAGTGPEDAGPQQQPENEPPPENDEPYPTDENEETSSVEGPSIEEVLAAAEEAGAEEELASDLDNEAEGERAASTSGRKPSSRRK